MTKDGPTSGPKRFLEASRFLDPQKVSAPVIFFDPFGTTWAILGATWGQLGAKGLPKGAKMVQNEAKIDAKIIDVSCFFEKGEN